MQLVYLTMLTTQEFMNYCLLSSCYAQRLRFVLKLLLALTHWVDYYFVLLFPQRFKSLCMSEGVACLKFAILFFGRHALRIEAEMVTGVELGRRNNHFTAYRSPFPSLMEIVSTTPQGFEEERQASHFAAEMDVTTRTSSKICCSQRKT